jgi:hypothetical protein
VLSITGLHRQGQRSPARPPGGQRGEPLAEAGVSDVPLLLVDGYALLVTVHAKC